jgi:hypothetical protein
MKMGRVGHVAHMVEMHTILYKKAECERPLQKQKSGLENNIKVNI